MKYETVLHLEKPRRDFVLKAEDNDLDGLNYLAGKTMDYVNQCAMQGTMAAHVEGGVPNFMVHIPEQNEFYLGQLFYFFEFAVGVSGYINGINPFDQPGAHQKVCAGPGPFYQCAGSPADVHIPFALTPYKA